MRAGTPSIISQSADVCIEVDCHRTKFKEKHCKHHFA